jgi:hypothetical protein
MKKKYWQILLCEWNKKGFSGLTIPFIIGSQDFFGFKYQQSLISLFDDIIHTRTTLIQITYCLTIHDIILKVHNPEMEKYGFYPKHRGEDQNTLFISGFFGDDFGKTCEDIAQNLNNRYEDCIKMGQFSKNGRSRSGFLSDERTFIKECVNILSKS